jgi:hypothetical protein
MSQVASEHDQAMAARGRGDGDIRQSRRVAPPAREIEQTAGDPCDTRIRGRDVRAVKMRHRFQPGGQPIRLCMKAMARRLGDTGLYLDDGDGGRI